MNNPEFELLVYLITSAKALPEEPACYGSIRLTEAASRLCKIICEKYPENDAPEIPEITGISGAFSENKADI